MSYGILTLSLPGTCTAFTSLPIYAFAVFLVVLHAAFILYNSVRFFWHGLLRSSKPLDEKYLTGVAVNTM